MKYLNVLLVFIPITLVARFILHASDGVVFATSCLSIIPLAVIIGDATEQISLYTGPKVGGFLNATMGNVPELLIAGFSVKAGLYSLVLATLAGSIMGNIMLVMGLSIFLGGLNFKFQIFNKNLVRSNFALLSFAAFSIIIPFAFESFSNGTMNDAAMSKFSLMLAITMLAVYVIGLYFSLFTHKDTFQDVDEDEEHEEPKWKMRTGVMVLIGATFFVAIMSETLVATVETAAEQFHLSEAFIGIILIPILGNVAEHASAMIMAYKGKLDIAIEIAAGSSMQIALLVTPLMVVLSAILGNTMHYVYTASELLAIVIGIMMAGFVLMDNKTNWLEGFQLMIAYFVIGAAFLIFGI